MNVLIAGCGYVGTALGERLIERGHRVWGLRRDPAGLPAAFHKVAADLASASDLCALPPDIDSVVYAASAGESTDAAYQRAYVTGLRTLLGALEGAHRLRRILFTSSTAVYAQADGSWVDETSETIPTHFSGIRTLEAEKLVLGASAPATVLRCAGIYGPGRTRLIESVRQGRGPLSGRFTNRIHRDDVAGATVHLLDHPPSERVIILCDDAPAPEREVTSFLAERLGLPPPLPTAPEQPGRGGHKRCRNDRLKATGYQLQYPTYREGYSAMLAKPP